MKALSKIYHYFNKTMEWIVFALLTVSVLSTMLGIVSRLIPGMPVYIWTEELTRFSVIVMVFLVSGIAMQRGVHLGIDFLHERLSPSKLKILLLFNNTILTVFMAFIAVISVKMAINNFEQTSVTLKIPISVPFFAIPVGCVMIVVELIRQSWKLLRKGET